MAKPAENSEITYVLFGKEAVKLYKVSLKVLINSLDVHFHVGAYSSVKKFVHDTQSWDDFTEISKEDFLTLRKLTNKNMIQKPKKRAFLSKLFK